MEEAVWRTQNRDREGSVSSVKVRELLYSIIIVFTAAGDETIRDDILEYLGARLIRWRTPVTTAGR